MQYSKTFNILTIKIMKIFKFMTLALVAMLGFSSCSEDCDHNFIEYDYSNALVGTWTFVEGGLAEAMVIKEDGSFAVTGVMADGSLYESKGTMNVVNNKVTFAFDGDKEAYEGRLELVAGKSFSIVLNEEYDIRLTYDYCANDLSDEVVGMWVCNDAKDNMRIQTFEENGNTVFSGWSEHLGEFSVLDNANYKVVGDLIFQGFSNAQKPSSKYIAAKLIYAPNGTAHGDIMTFKHYLFDGIESAESWLRIKQSLDLADQKYDYIKTFVSNVKGEDKDIDFMGYTFNFAKMDGSGLDKMLKALLFAVEFPDANTLGYSYQLNGNKETYNSPIVVEGNTMTIKMSEKVATLKDVVLYAFQDADCSQMHFYMHKTAFVNFYTNMQAMLMAATDEQFDINNAEAVNAIYNEINNAVQTINVSLVMSK